jgi:type II secretory pathway pseudopilin PulG
MKKTLNKKGSSIIEIIVAIGIFIMVSSSIVVLVLGSYGTSLRDIENLQADMYLQQGFEAVRSIGNYSFAGLTNGTYGLSRASGYWAFSGSSDVNGQFARTVTITDVNRDTSSCAIVASGGTSDVSSKKITVTIAWDLETGQHTSVSSSQYLTDWKNPSLCGNAVDNLLVGTSSAILTSGDKQLEGITLENTGSSDIEIDKITVTWSNGAKIEEIQIAGISVWKSSGTGTPTGQQSSGTQINIENYVLTANTMVDMDVIKFDKSMKDATFSITFTMADGSSSIISGIKP